MNTDVLLRLVGFPNKSKAWTEMNTLLSYPHSQRLRVNFGLSSLAPDCEFTSPSPRSTVKSLTFSTHQTTYFKPSTMPEFTDLPLEIMTIIAESVLPDDIENFSATCKDIWFLSKPLLQKHKELRRWYKNNDCIGDGSPLKDLLYDILIQPTVALYVECITIDTWYDCWDQGPSPRHIPYPHEEMVRLEEAVAELVPSDQVSAWISAIKSGDEDPILALLLLQLPKITEFNMMIMGPTYQRLFQTLTRILAAPGLSLLPNLTSVDINWEESKPDPLHRDWQAINTFAKLPSLRNLTAWNVYIENNDDDSHYLLQPRTSNVSSLMLTECFIGIRRLSRLLQGFRALKRVTYDGYDFNQVPFDLFRVRAALRAHTKASLEYLKILQFDPTAKRYMGSLRDFKNLIEIETDLILLENLGCAGRVNLVEMLPASVQKLHLHEWRCDWPESILDLIPTGAKDEQKLLPNLKVLHLTLHTKSLRAVREKRIAGMIEECDKAGFELIVDRGRA